MERARKRGSDVIMMPHKAKKKKTRKNRTVKKKTTEMRDQQQHKKQQQKTRAKKKRGIRQTAPTTRLQKAIPFFFLIPPSLLHLGVDGDLGKQTKGRERVSRKEDQSGKRKQAFNLESSIWVLFFLYPSQMFRTSLRRRNNAAAAKNNNDAERTGRELRTISASSKTCAFHEYQTGREKKVKGATNKKRKS